MIGGSVCFGAGCHVFGRHVRRSHLVPRATTDARISSSLEELFRFRTLSDARISSSLEELFSFPASVFDVDWPAGGGMSEEIKKLIDSWVAPEKWPTPKWIAKPGSEDRVHDFEAYYTHQLRTRYSELEGDFRSIVANYQPHDVPTAKAIVGLLQSVRPNLESSSPDLLAVASTLDQAERYMPWIYPTHILVVRLASTTIRLQTLRPPGWELYLQLLQRNVEPEAQRMPLDEAIGVCNRHSLNEEIANGLQIRRLKTYRTWSVVVLFSLLLLSPLLVKRAADGFWPGSELDLGDLGVWIPSISVLVVGMLGGFVSGLLQVTGSRVTLSDYRESMAKLSVRPILGGLAALVLYVLLSWGLIPAVKTDTAGAYLLVAFFAGFSERYLLRLIDPQGQATQEPVAGSPVGRATAALPPGSPEG